MFYSFVAAAVSDPYIAATLADAKSGTEAEVVRLLRAAAPHIEAPDDQARSLLALSDGLTMRVLIGSLTAEEALKSLRLALADVSALPCEPPEV